MKAVHSAMGGLFLFWMTVVFYIAPQLADWFGYYILTGYQVGFAISIGCIILLLDGLIAAAVRNTARVHNEFQTLAQQK